MLETTIAAGLFALLCVVCLRLISATLQWSNTIAARNNDAAAVGQLTDRWRIEQDSAWAIFTPPNDVNGASNADYHELDFFTRDGKNRSYFWSYTYDPGSQTLTRYLYAAPGAAPTKDATFTGVTKFVAHTYPVTALSDQSTPVYSPLYQSASLQAGAVRFYPANAPWIEGGNQVTYVHVETASQVFETQLSTQTAPSGFTIVLSYTPSPAPMPSATTGPLVTLGKIVFEPGSLAYDSPAQRLARGLNSLLGGGMAQASTPCSYAQLYLQNGSVDSNSQDGFNTTDAQGCVTNDEVRLWATESGYPSTDQFSEINPASAGCQGYLSVSPYSWYPGRYAVVTPLSGSSGCSIEVYSQDRNATNDQAANVLAVINAPPCTNGVTCYAELVTTTETYEMKCAGGGAVGPPCPLGGSWFWRDSYILGQYSSDDGGNSWTAVGANYACSSINIWTSSGPAPGTSCKPSQTASSFAYTGTRDTWQNLNTNQNSGPTYSWKPSVPPSTP